MLHDNQPDLLKTTLTVCYMPDCKYEPPFGTTPPNFHISVYVLAHKYDAPRIQYWALRHAAAHLRRVLDSMQSHVQEAKNPSRQVLASTVKAAYDVNVTDRSQGFDMLQNAIIGVVLNHPATTSFGEPKMRAWDVKRIASLVRGRFVFGHAERACAQSSPICRLWTQLNALAMASSNSWHEAMLEEGVEVVVLRKTRRFA
ncbi:uncharacterized protein M421DRAFT_90161 [Didymella exigua CBS 183.55]|uniref:Uncharacterized protein n=1 Tax=Didymella exigua CBS 183.55 TaxID=1150837 RepID=A0A6A5RU55_9PLEO|nr:uncharacterized protein M421DRAFT_90161 [Didymella exigua CBS 183.55]KAF1931971.1 hypothetical protein M421DRAFT_90161 [Didymella exigua CBS 183.55]